MARAQRMRRRWREVLLVALAGSFGCGGASPAPSTRLERAASAESDDQRLDARREVPGTGVSLRPPRGSEPMPIGAGFVHRTLRVQLFVAAAAGGAEVLAAFRRGVESDADPEVSEDVVVAGRPARLRVDRQTSRELAIERVWALIEDDGRAFVVAGAYDAARSDRLRPLLRASILSAEWSPEAPLDPELAVGFRLRPPEGLVLDRSSTGSIAYGREGQLVPPVVGAPTLFLIPVPTVVPLAQRDELCEPILAQLGPVPDERVRSRGRIETDDVEGCEVTGWQEHQESEGQRRMLATYAAIVFRADETFLVAGVVADAEREAWLPRFAAAARTVSAAR